MSDINLDFSVSNENINFTVQPNEITFTPSDVQLTIATNIGSPVATSLNANINDVHISGGTNGYVLQTDGSGNLSWTAQTGGGGGNGTPGGANTQIQYNDSGSFGGNAGFTFNEVTGNVAIPGNVSIAGNITGNLIIGNGTFISNITGANINGEVPYAAIANSVAGANVSGQVGNALIAETVYSNSQPNINSLGTLISLSVTGTSSIQQAKEKIVQNGTGATGSLNFDLLTSAIQLQTANATGNFTLNFRGNGSTTLDSVMSSNQSMTCTFINKNGVTAYIPTSLSVDGNVVTPLWSSPGSPAPGTPSGYDSYTFNIIKTAGNTFAVFAGRAGYL